MQLTPEQQAAARAFVEREYAIFHYKPSPNQLAFHQDCQPNKLTIGGSRSGKTTANIVEVCWLAMGIHPYKENAKEPLSILILSLTRQNASQVTQRKMFESCELPGPIGAKPFLPESELMPGEHTPLRVGFPTYYRVKLMNNTVIEWAWSDDPASFIKVQGAKRHIILLDEARCDRKLFLELTKRLADARSEAERGLAPSWYGMLLWGATGTGDGGDDGTFDSFRQRCMDAHPGHSYFLLKPGETGAIDAKVTAQMRSIMSEEEQAIHIDGTSTAGGAQRVYPQFTEERHCLPTDYEPGPQDNLWLGLDPGWNHPTGLVIFAITPKRPMTKIAVRCWKHRHQTVDYDIACLDHYLRGRQLAGVVYDWNTNAGSKQGAGQTMLQEYKEKMIALGMYPIAGFFRGKKNNEKGIPLVALHLDPDHYDKSVEPRLLVNPSQASGCSLLKEEFYKYRGRPETRFRGPMGIVKKWDDLMDPLKYVCCERAANSYNPVWACGPVTKGEAPIAVQPAMLEPQGVSLTPDELQLKRSKELRARYGREDIGAKMRRMGIRFGGTIA